MSIEIKTAAEWLRLSHIDRWAIISTATRQSVAEHTWRVWALVHIWGPKCGLTAGEQAIAERYALLHDMPEIRTGDMPTTIKTPEAKAAMAAFERSALPELAQAEDGLPRHVADLVKACDTAEAILFLKVHGLGRHADDVRRLLEAQMSDRLSASALSDEVKETIATLFLDTYHDT
jgi:5'-deoxynucleotidase YfbR-like HD superfamily hydrolase